MRQDVISSRRVISGNVPFHPALNDLLEPIELVRPHPDNPNSGDQDAIAESIEINGMYRPVEVQLSTGFILAGNTTYASCLMLESELIPVIWLDVDDETALRILLGDNELARLARIDRGLLNPLLETLMATEMKLLGTGYTIPAAIPEPGEIEPHYTVTVVLDSNQMATWFDLPADTDRERFDYLLGLR